MADVSSKLVTQNGDTVVLKEDSIPAASSLTRGGVKQGDSVAKPTTYYNDDLQKSVFETLDSLRSAGIIENTKFVLLYDFNAPDDEVSGEQIFDTNIYTNGQSATIKFVDDDKEQAPSRDGYTFLGWATSSSAVTATYPYDEYDPQTYTVTFTDNDIVLYAVWQLRTCTVTYSLGDYGTGSVPTAQTVQEGSDVQLSFSPAPTVNDGSGRIFAGWSTSDGVSSWGQVTYDVNGHDEIEGLYSDVTLYPCFVAQYTLTYALGNDATGTVPSGATYWNGQDADLNFNPSVTCVSDNTKVFVGWSETDEDTTAYYTTGGTNSVYMNKNLTLYPVFAAQAQGGSITIVNTNTKGYAVEVYNEGSSILTIAAGTQEVFNYTPGAEYEIRSTLNNGTFDGVYNGTQYSNVSLQYSSGSGKFFNPSTSSTDWEFSSGDSGTLTISIS